MTDFDQSLWAESRFAQDYRDQAEHIIQKRQELFRILRSFHRFFARRSSPIHVCDLGCGDGALAQQLLEEDPSLKATLIDGSEEMLAAARNRLAPYPNVSLTANRLRRSSPIPLAVPVSILWFRPLPFTICCPTKRPFPNHSSTCGLAAFSEYRHGLSGSLATDWLRGLAGMGG